jgi:monovalent cation:H+ antiporter-2, CPA2 family
VHGDATDPAVLIQAHIAQARLLVIATAASVDARPMIEAARTLNPSIQTVVRALSDEEAQRLQADGALQALVAETELARGVVRRVQTALQRSGDKNVAH